MTSGPLRPNRSDSVPWLSWPIASPANQAASVSCAEPAGAWNDVSIAGNAGRYISVVAGPTAVRKPSNSGSHEGKLMRLSLQAACQMASAGQQRAARCRARIRRLVGLSWPLRSQPDNGLVGHPHHQLPGVLAAEQHTETGRSTFQAVKHVQALRQAAGLEVRGQPASRLAIAGM